MSQLTIISARDEILGAEKDFEAVSGATLNFRKEFAFAMQALEKNDFLLKTALGNPQSLKNAIVNIGAVGLSLNPAERLAYILPMDNAVQLMVSYIGLVALAVKDGGILWASANIVREKDTFRLNGYDKQPTHSYDPFSTEGGKVTGVYSVGKTQDGSYLVTTMTYDECIAIRNRTKIWAKNQSGPWKSDEEEMIKKTVIKRASKLWPRGSTARLQKAIDVINDFEGIDFTPEPPAQNKISSASNILNLALGAPVDPEVKQSVEMITSICKVHCENFTLKEKGGFMLKVLQVSTFNELYTKDLDYLKELLAILSELVTPTINCIDDSIVVDAPKWDD